LRIDKDKFYKNTCKKCVKHNICYGSNMLACARMRLFNREEFEKMTKAEEDK